MDPAHTSSDRIDRAAALLRTARAAATRLDGLPPECRPATLAEAHAIQDRIVTLGGGGVAGWKVNALPGRDILRGTLETARVFSSGARIDCAGLGILGLEGELAFRLLRPLPARKRPWDVREVAEAVEVLPALDLVGTRYHRFMELSALERVADGLNLGAFVAGPAAPGARAVGLGSVRATVWRDGVRLGDHRNAHPAGDPLLPLVLFANARREAEGLAAGMIVTTGSCTGLLPVEPGCRLQVDFEGIGSVAAELV